MQKNSYQTQKVCFSFLKEYSFCSHKYEEEKPDKKTWLSFEND